MEEQKLPRFDRRLDAEDHVSLGVEGDRIVEVVESAIVSITELLQEPDFGESLVKLRKDLHRILASRKVVLTRVTFPLPNSAVSDMVLSLDMKRKSVSVQSTRHAKKRVLLNTVLRTIR